MVLKPDEINIPLGQTETQFITDSDDFLDGEHRQGSEDVRNTANYLASGLLTYAAMGAAPRVLRESGIPDEIFRQGKYANNIIKGFYAKGATGFDKLKLQWDHFGYGDPQRASTYLDAQRFVKDYNNDIVYRQTGLGRHRSGHAIQAMEELDTLLNKGDGWNKKVGSLKKVPGTNRFMREYNTTLDYTDHKLLKQLQEGIKSNKIRYSTLGHMNQEIELAHKFDTGNLRGRGTLQHDIRSEIAKTELVEHVTRGDANYNRLKVEGGISKPVRMNAGHFFQHHANMWPDLKAHDNLTVSKIAHSGDHTKQINAARKSPLFKIAKHVYSKVDDLTDRKAVMQAAMERASNMGTSPYKSAADKLHPHSKGALKEVENFMSRYRVTPDGKLSINFSPDYKPHKLLGGTNANIIFSSGKTVNKNPIQFLQGFKNLDKLDQTNYVMSPARGLGTKVHTEILVTDMYDIAGSSAQGTKHVTYAYQNTDKKAGNSFNKNASTEVLPNRERFVQAAKDGDIEGMRKYGGRTSSKVIQKTAERLSSRNLFTKLPSKVLGKLAPALNATTIGKAINIGGGILSASELTRQAKGLFGDDEENEKYFS